MFMPTYILVFKAQREQHILNMLKFDEGDFLKRKTND